jgi:hypothetical protein
LDLIPIGRALPWCCDTEWTATGVTVTITEPKPQAVVGVTIKLAAADPAPAANVRLWWCVNA